MNGMQERRLKRLGLLDDDGSSTYDGALSCEASLSSTLFDRAHSELSHLHTPTSCDGKIVILHGLLRKACCVQTSSRTV